MATERGRELASILTDDFQYRKDFDLVVFEDQLGGHEVRLRAFFKI